MASTALVLLMAPAAWAQQLPTGGAVTAGAAAIAQSGPGSLMINQSSSRAILSWQSFSIGQGGTVAFNNGSGATLNRVTGNVPSRIDGTLTATGSVYLVNPAGVAVGSNGRVATGGSFIASTQNITDKNFLDGGDLTFAGDSKAAVVNAGKIGALGGDVALIARKVVNTGTITAPEGTVGLAAGYEVLVKDGARDGGRFAVKVGGADTEVKTSGAIRAATAELRANGGNVYALAGNTKGVIAATGTATKGGRIYLTAGEGSVVAGGTVAASRTTRNGAKAGGDIRVSGRNVKVAGTLAAQGIGAKADGATGGTVVVEGKAISLAGSALVDVSGASGGTALIGGDWQGGVDPAKKALAETVKTASLTNVEAGARLLADGRDGDGGTIVVWADGTTRFSGAISARGAGAGHGGTAEVSGKGVLAFSGTADLRAEAGRTGDLLLDPYNLTISNAASSNVSGTTAVADNSVLNAGTLLGLLSTANVTVSTGAAGDPGSQAGDITVAAPVSWSSNTVLTLAAAGNIRIDADITATGTSAGLVLQYGAGKDYAVTGGSVTLSGTGATLQIGAAGALQSYTLIHSVAELDAIDATGLAGHYALAQDLDAAGVTYGEALAGTQAQPFAGTFAGLGHTLSNLTISAPASSFVGLFGVTGTGAVIRDFGLVGGSITGDGTVGALVGANYGGRITNAYATGAVTGGRSVGGLVGVNSSDIANPDAAGSITNAYATGAVRGVYAVGGLVGYNGADIVNAYATGAVAGGDNVGGLVGENYGAATSNVYATGAVTGGSAVGGLVGQNGGSLTNAYATGAVSGSGSVGGLVGESAASITNAYATGAVSGGSSVGGLVGTTAIGAGITNAYATGAVSGDGTVGGLVGTNDFGSITNAYATGAVSGRGSVGGLVGQNFGPVTASFWDTGTTGQQGAIGGGEGSASVSALDVSTAYTQASYTGQGWDFSPSGAWFMVDGATRPFLRSEHSTTIRNAHQLQLMAMDPTARYVLASDIDLGPELSSPASLWRTSTGFAPVGSREEPFRGIFDGQGHVISNLKIDRETNSVGLFGHVASGAAIRNVGLLAASVTGRDAVGALAGYNEGGITNAYATGTVTGTNVVGGLAGINAGGVTNAYAASAVTGESSVGGFVGFNNGGGIANVYATGAVSGGSLVGGLAGANDANITNAYATGAVTGTNVVGGLVGNNFGTVTASFWDTGTTGQSQAIGTGAGLASVSALDASTAYTQASYTSQGWDFSSSGAWFMVAGATRPFLRSEHSTTIRNAHQLQLMAMDLTAHYVLANDIDLGPELSSPASLWRAASGFAPVGPDAESAFSGTFDGRGHVISNLKIILSETDSVGLFGSVASGAAIRDVGLLAASVTGGSFVGGLVGSNSGSITNVSVTGVVTGSNFVGGLVGLSSSGRITDASVTGVVTGSDGVGGLVGANAGSITNASVIGAITGRGLVGGLVGGNYGGDITNASATGIVTGTDMVGGLAGASFGNITNTYAAGTVTGSGLVGGLVGNNSGSITNAYASSAVTGLGTVGGLVGVNEGGSILNAYATGAVTGRFVVGGLVGANVIGASIANAYATGAVTGRGSVGGFVGENYGDIAASFWDTRTTGQRRAIGNSLDSPSVSALDASTAYAQATYSGRGWDFSAGGAWFMVEGSTRPFLRSEHSTTIRNSHQLQLMVLDLAANYVLANDIDLGPELSSPASMWRTTSGFVPVGSEGYSAFWGSFDGQGHVISNLKIDRETDSVGLFGRAMSGTAIRNVGLLSASVTGGIFVGGLVGSNSGSITNSYLTGAVVGRFAVGGLVGSNSGSITDVHAAGTVMGDSIVGGLVGSNSGSITNAYAMGTISGGSTVGGLVGASLGSITNAYATGAVMSRGSVGGGLVGTNAIGASITNAYATGAVSGSDYIGGLVGMNFGSITNAYAAGAVLGRDDVGGLLGSNTSEGGVAASFWDTQTTGQDQGTGPHSTGAFDAFGLTTAAFQGTAAFMTLARGVGWSFEENWAPPSAGYYPELYALSPVVWISGRQVTSVYGDETGTALTTSRGGPAKYVFGPAGDSLNLPQGIVPVSPTANAGITTTAFSAAGQTTSAKGQVYRTLSFGTETKTVARAMLTVTATSPASVVYGAGLPSFGYDVAGWKNGQSTGDNLDDLVVSSTAGSQPGVGTYAVTASGGTLTGVAAGNYTLTYASTAFQVTPRPIIVTADGKTRIYGDANPALTYSVGGAGLAYGQHLLLATLANGTSGVGSYGITLVENAVTANYAISYAGASLLVTPRPITVAANDETMMAGGAQPPLTWQLAAGTLVNGDALSGALARDPGTAPGDYAIRQGTLAATANYALTYVPGLLTILAEPVPPVPPVPPAPPEPPVPPGNVLPSAQEIALITALTPQSHFVQTTAPAPFVWFDTPAGAAASGAGSAASRASLAECQGGAASTVCVHAPHPANRTYGRSLSWGQ